MPPHSRAGSKKAGDAPPPAGFAEFWLSYPKKVSKPAALKAFNRAIRKVTLERMMGSLELQKQTWDPKYTKNPATWLNNDCWDDEEAKQPARSPFL